MARVLVANRGEIAVRVIRACRELGIGTVAVCSEVDRHALHAEMADIAVTVGPAEPGESYLRADRILEAAKATDSDAIHPGYGFLAENAEFARACADAGVVFIGPAAEVIEQMGEKTAARAIMQKAGVPVVPGDLLPEPDADGKFPAEEVLAIARKVGFPVMVKAAFGGGGKGMRQVESEDKVVAACEAAYREALGAFGNGTVYIERFIEHPRHVEFQIFGDNHGNAVHLFERECSIQRRHQKIIEETPSPALNPELREKMGAAAVAAAQAVGYQGAGTVEFLLGPTGEFFFLEMNTRLQVEHPVTELVTGADLVRAQIRVAEGRPLPWTQDEITCRGHAIECRVYAEDPENGFMPSLGPILLLNEPSGPGVRIDSGVRQGDEVSMYYDPMIAKLSLHGQDRAAAIDRAVTALKDYAVLGVTTNVEYLIAILQEQAFLDGDLHTGFLVEHLPDWGSSRDQDEGLALAVASVAEYDRLQRGLGLSGTPDPGAPTPALTSPWTNLGRFRLSGLG
ncbi:MAG: acetyl-CoA carboxylase biotin carboxylase subunit [Gemmatimonadales bacterium]|nr:acetyl-CoA carboxylase biotin carboxylase subunit [Gemmatimonadales bacterium]